MFSNIISGRVGASDPELDAHIRALELQRRDVDSKLAAAAAAVAAAVAAADTHCLYSVDGHRRRQPTAASSKPAPTGFNS